MSKSGMSSTYSVLYNYNPLTYRGYIYDTETGFYYLQSRYYDPTIGRFINADGQLNGGFLGYNQFAYCENNPVMYSDPSGHQAMSKLQDELLIGLAAIGLLMATDTLSDSICETLSALWSCIADAWNSFIGLFSKKAKTQPEAKPKDRILSDVEPRVSNSKHYYLAYIDNSTDELVKVGKAMTFVEAATLLGAESASNSLSKRYKSIEKAPDEVLNKSKWGVYTTHQENAKALAVVFGCVTPPEVHGSGYYGHYHSTVHEIHFWYGYPIQYSGG